MPPPRKNPAETADEDIFVNREGPIRIFEDAAFTIPSDGAIIRVFYGVGGQGKTALCRKLIRLTDPAVEPSYGFLRRAELDLRGRPTDDPDRLVIWIRNAFASVGIAFPAFDIALALAWEATRGDEPFPALTNPWLARSSDTIVGVAPDAVETLREAAEQTVERIPFLGALITRGSRWVIDKAKRAYLDRARPYLKELYRDGVLKKPYELSDLLPWILAQDLNHRLSHNPKERFLLLIDEYERVVEGAGTGPRWREDPFDRHMRTVVQETNGLLAVFFSREKLRWDEDDDWHDDLDGAQHPIDALSEADADDWLMRVPIADEAVRRAMIESAREEANDGAKIYPLLLFLQIKHWRALCERDAAITADLFQIEAVTFKGRCRQLVRRLLRDYSDPLQLTLERLAVADRFDRGAFDHVVRSFGTRIPNDSFDRLASLSIVSRGDNGYLTLYRPVAEVIRETLAPIKRRETIASLLSHYQVRASVNHPRHVSDATVAASIEAAFLRRQGSAEGYVFWLAKTCEPLWLAARHAVLERLWREALSFVEAALGSEHPDTATCYYNVAYALSAQGRFKDAAPLHRKGLQIRQRVSRGQPSDMATSDDKDAHTSHAHGRYEAPESLYRKGVETSPRVLGRGPPPDRDVPVGSADTLGAIER